MRRDAFQAIADPTRRAILDLLVAGPRNLNAVAGAFSLSRPAISKHIKILTECGLVEIHARGRDRYCYAQPAPLKLVSHWIAHYQQFWDRKLDALEEYLASGNPGQPKFDNTKK